jgi:PDZ domain-containing protein
MSLVLIAVAMLSMQGVSPASRVIEGKFDTATEQVLIPVTIGGHAFWCNPDSAWSAPIALDETKAIAAGIAVAPPVATPDGNPARQGDHSATATVAVGGITFADQSIILRHFPEEAPDMDCAMGIAWLRPFIVEVEHMTPRLILHDRASYRPPAGTDAIPLLFRTNPRVPYIDIAVTIADGSTYPLRVVPDTGAAFYGAVVVGDAAARLKTAARTAPAITYADSRINQILAARSSVITVGRFAVSNLVVAVIDGDLGSDGSIADGLLGSGFLRRFSLAFDFEGRTLHLTPNERLSQSHPFDASGIGFIRRDGRHVVYGVIPRTPAADAGIQAGDVLLQIDDRAAGDLTPLQLRTLLSADGIARRLVLERDGRMITLLLMLKKRI